MSDKQTVYKFDGTTLSTSVKLKAAADVISAGESLLFAWSAGTRKITSIDAGGVVHDIVSNCDVNTLCASSKGVYFSDSKSKRIGYYSFATEQVQYFATDFQPAGLAISAERTFLNAGTKDTPFAYSFKIDADGTLDDGQPYVHYHIPYGATVPGLGGMIVDDQNLLYTATAMGVQVSDQLGRMNFIFSKTENTIVDVALGGAAFDLLYTLGEGKIFVRKVNAKGLTSFGAAVHPPKPGL